MPDYVETKVRTDGGAAVRVGAEKDQADERPYFLALDESEAWLTEDEKDRVITAFAQAQAARDAEE